ncbi:sporulation protein Cse60 [Streptococcus suis]|uniref:sporulation protein Cse60 n=1 Tax=Streptococcus suis TaxID=1307 RepID=UPI000402E7E4|nr:sporulation protein Cse60 [Streptococcus suis]
MKKVKVFMSQYHKDIEEEVNEFLAERIFEVKLIDVKYNSIIAIDGYNKVVEQYSALLIYEEAENDTEV